MISWDILALATLVLLCSAVVIDILLKIAFEKGANMDGRRLAMSLSIVSIIFALVALTVSVYNVMHTKAVADVETDTVGMRKVATDISDKIYVEPPAEEASAEPAPEEEAPPEPAPEEETYIPEEEAPTEQASVSQYDGDFRSAGIVYGENGYSYTWYSQNVLPGSGLTELNNNGRHVDERGFVCDGDGYIAVASDDHTIGTVVETPFGEGRVYDSGSGSGNIDIYTDY